VPATIVRLFIALNIPVAERQAIHAATAVMREAARGVAWVTEDRLHLTLKFLGEQPEGAISGLRTALATSASGHRPLRLELGGLGAFPNLRAPRVVWMGVSHDARLELLHHDIENVCATLGYALDGRAFRPHITLGRVRRELGREPARALARAARGVSYTGTMEVETVDLMLSELTPTGPRYSVLAAIPLGGL
jgi:2'-5' RNA ligase